MPQIAPVDRWRWRLEWDAAQGRTPMISIGYGTDVRDVADGRYDAELRSFRTAIEQMGAPVLVRYAYEMDGAQAAPWVHSGADFVQAWKHVHSLFAGSPVRMVWSPNAPAFDGRDGGVQQYWPGADQVDWIAADGYNFYRCQGGDVWKTFDTIYTGFVRWAEPKGKPMMIAEFGTVEDSSRPGRKAEWLREVADRAAESGVQAMVYFDSNRGCDWRLTTSAETRAAVRQLADSVQLTGVIGPDGRSVTPGPATGGRG
ncbi:MAG: glycoside hydrolase family 26 protein [Angustibacter sp.]